MRDKLSNFGKYLEEFTQGEIYYHEETHTISKQEILDFCKLTCNSHPLHSDSEYAKHTRFGQIVVAGTHVFSLVVGLSVADISGKAIANLQYDRVIHHAPVLIGDTIHAQSRILNIIPSEHKKLQGVIVVETEAFNQNNERVLSYTRNVLIPSSKKG